MNNNRCTDRRVTVDGCIIIDQHGECQYDSEGVRNDLIKLKELIQDLAVSSQDTGITVSRYESAMMILNWLVYEVDMIDIR